MEINATELKIGNWYHQEGTKVVERDSVNTYLTHITNYKEEDICLSVFDLHLQTSKIFNKPELEPILLTEEWYIKFGYECLQELIVDMIHNAIHPISDNIGLWATTIAGLKVHELQDLYFALTNKELKIN